MGPTHKYSEVGGGPATGLANDFIGWLQQGLQTGSFGGGTAGQRFGGADPMGSSAGISGVLNDLLAGGGGRIGGSMSELISKQGDRDVNALRARFGASGGTAFGTGAQYAESLLRSETAPKLTQAVGGLQLGALQSLLPMFAGLSQKGIAQREGYLEPNGWLSTLQAISPIISAGLPFLTGNPLAAAGAAAGAGSTMAAPSVRGLSQFQMPAFTPAYQGARPLSFGGIG